VGAISAIAEPESFETGLRKLGGLVEVHARFADHHRYAVDEVARFLERCQRRDLDLVVTTEKDAVRFPPRPAHLPVPVYFLRIDIEILEGRAAWEKMIARFVIRRDALEPLIVG
jgi:tetraacyldisaccharide 4'-kinase